MWDKSYIFSGKRESEVIIIEYKYDCISLLLDRESNWI